MSVAAYLSIHNMAGWMIDRFGDREQRARFLPKLTTMEHFASYCLTEPGSGSDAAALKTTARRDGDDYVLNGVKAFISGGRGTSERWMSDNGDAAGRRRGNFRRCRRRESPGLWFGKKEQKLGWEHRSRAAMVPF